MSKYGFKERVGACIAAKVKALLQPGAQPASQTPGSCLAVPRGRPVQLRTPCQDFMQSTGHLPCAFYLSMSRYLTAQVFGWLP